MLEVSLKHDGEEIQLLRVLDDIDTEALVNLIRAALNAHKSSRLHLSQINDEVKRNPAQRIRKPINGLDKKHPKMTSSGKAVLLTLAELTEPFLEARIILNIAKQDKQFKGNSVEAVRHYLREFEAAGWLRRNSDNTRELTAEGINFASDLKRKEDARNEDTFNDVLLTDDSSKEVS